MAKRRANTWPINLEKFQARIHYCFKDAELLNNVFTHKSKGLPNNERLEALGQKVVECVLVEALYRRNPDLDEGRLTGILNRICSNYSMLDHAYAVKIRVYSFNLRFNMLKEALADAFQALVGAIYLDGGYDAVCVFISREFENDLNILTPAPEYQMEYSRFIRRHFNQDPHYENISKSGAIIQGLYKYVVTHAGATIGKGRGHSPAQAKSNAAREALVFLKQLYPGLE